MKYRIGDKIEGETIMISRGAPQMTVPTPKELRFILVKIACFLILYVLTFLIVISLILGENAMWFSIMNKAPMKIIFGLYLGLTGFSIYKVAPWKALDTITKLRELGRIATGKENVFREIHITAEIFVAALFWLEAVIFVIWGIIEYVGLIPSSPFFSTIVGEFILFFCFTIPFGMGAACKAVYEQQIL